MWVMSTSLYALGELIDRVSQLPYLVELKVTVENENINIIKDEKNIR